MTTGKPLYARPSQRQRTFARRMRKNLTEAEKRLWWVLRHRIELRGTHFRRQVAIGFYIADFCCIGCRLIIEADGGQHYTDEAAQKDAARTAALETYGFEVLRFTNTMILTEIDIVVATIFAALVRRDPRLGMSDF